MNKTMAIPDPTQIGCGGWTPQKAGIPRASESQLNAAACKPTGIEAMVAPATTCLRIERGHYSNWKGAWMDILDVQMPGYPKYDGGATGVSILWGRNRWFVLACDEEHFWSQFPYSVLKGCFDSTNAEVRHGAKDADLH